jgi:hypothetical protein
MFQSVQQPPCLPIEFSVDIKTNHSVKLSLKKIFSLRYAYSMKLRTILYFSGYEVKERVKETAVCGNQRNELPDWFTDN